MFLRQMKCIDGMRDFVVGYCIGSFAIQNWSRLENIGRSRHKIPSKNKISNKRTGKNQQIFRVRHNWLGNAANEKCHDFTKTFVSWFNNPQQSTKLTSIKLQIKLLKKCEIFFLRELRNFFGGSSFCSCFFVSEREEDLQTFSGLRMSH